MFSLTLSLFFQHLSKLTPGYLIFLWCSHKFNVIRNENVMLIQAIMITAENNAINNINNV